MKITREGRYYLGFTLGVGLAATNTGNNLLYLILGLLLSLIIVSGLLSEAALRRLKVTRTPMGPCRAGEASVMGVILHNGNRVLPSIGLLIDEVKAKDVSVAPGRCLRVLAGASVRASIRLTPHRRGEIFLVGLVVTTRYPFGIFAKSRRYEMPSTLLAWPARASVSTLVPAAGNEDDGPPVARRGGVEDLRGLRRFREGDETRLIHWRRSLRVGKELIVERDAPQGRRVRLELLPGGGDPFEEAISRVGSQAEDHLALGDEVMLVAPSGYSVPFGRGPGHRRRVLSALALVPPSSEASGGELVDARARRVERGSVHLKGSARSRGLGSSARGPRGRASHGYGRGEP